VSTPIPAQGAGRIRWTDEIINGHPVIAGYVGTLTEAAFRLYGPDDCNGRWLLATRLIAGTRFAPADEPGELKAAAECRLAELVASLGAIFPPVPGEEISDDEDGEPLEVRYAAGRRVRFEHPDNGYAADRLMAATFLTPGEVYTISRADVGQSSTRLDFAGIDTRRQGFNSVLFEPVDDGTPPATAGAAGEDDR
jgi:hypothetical protein